MKETNEQKIAHAEIKAAIENLISVCKTYKAAVLGFAFGITPPILIRFGNVQEKGADFTALLLKLEDTVNEKIEAGLSIDDNLNVKD
jgi:hypothetical protein